MTTSMTKRLMPRLRLTTIGVSGAAAGAAARTAELAGSARAFGPA